MITTSSPQKYSSYLKLIFFVLIAFDLINSTIFLSQTPGLFNSRVYPGISMSSIAGKVLAGTAWICFFSVLGYDYLKKTAKFNFWGYATLLAMMIATKIELIKIMKHFCF